MTRTVHVFILLLLSGLMFPLQAAQWTIGILGLRGDAPTRQYWQPLITALNQRIPGARFRLLPLGLNDMRTAISTGQVQFVLTNQAQFVQLNSHYHLRWLASLRSGHGPSATSMATGSTILVRRESNITRAGDLAGKTLGAVDPQAFGGYLLGYRELQKAGLQVDHQLTVRYMGFPADALLYLLRENAIQAAIVPVCLLENMEKEGLIAKNTFRVLLQKTTSFPCQTSTALYPDWSFAALPGVEDNMADAVTKALLNAPDTDKWRWGAPTSTSETEALLRALNRHPEQQRIAQTVLNWLNQHKPVPGLVLLLVVIFIANYAWVMVLVNRRGKALQRASHQLLEQQQTLERARQMSILGEMASGFAHELNQPLSAIRMYAQGGLNLLARPDNQAPLAEALSNIEAQAGRCGMIIKNLRAWATSGHPAQGAAQERVPCDIAQTLKHVLALLQLDKRLSGLTIHTDNTHPAQLMLPPVLLEQVLVNVILNAVQAGATALWITTQCSATRLHITLQDNAGGLTAEQSARIFHPFHSTKNSGIGLGLVICQRLLRGVSGDIALHNHPAPDGAAGACVTLTLPVTDNNENPG